MLDLKKGKIRLCLLLFVILKASDNNKFKNYQYYCLYNIR